MSYSPHNVSAGQRILAETTNEQDNQILYNEQQITRLRSDVGTISDLNTTATSIVGAINEVDDIAANIVAISDDEPSSTSTKLWVDAAAEEVQIPSMTDMNTALDGKISEPETEGTNGQLLMTDGNGGRSWTSVASPTDTQVASAVSDWLDAHPEATTTVEDGSITAAKLASDVASDIAQIDTLREEITDLNTAIENLEVIPHSVKMAMDTLFSKAAYADDDAASSYATFHAWATANPVTSISAVFTQGSATIYDTDSLDTLKQYLVVTATYSDSSTATVAAEGYALSGGLTEGTSIITVSYSGKTTTFSVTVTAILHPMVNASHTFTDGNVISVSNGNHVTLQLNSNITSGVGTGINLYDVTENKDTVYDSANVGSQSQKFVIPSGASCVFKACNFNTSLTFTGDIKFNLRNTNGTSIGSSSMINCGKTPTEQEYSATWTQSASVAIGLIFLFTNQISGAPGSLQFDIELYVNNERWI